MPHEQIIQYGWRIPFLISTLCWVILFFIRNNIHDVVIPTESARRGLLELIKTYKNQLITIFITASLSASAFYMTFIFMPTFLSSSLNLHSHQQSILITLICLSVYLLALPVGGMLADKIGIVRQIKIASILYLLSSYVCFAAIPSLNGMGCMAVLILFSLIQALLNSALPAFMVTQIDLSQRGKALAISYNMSLTIFGGLMPYLILTNEGYVNPGITISICAALTLLVIHQTGKHYGYIRSEPQY